MMVKNESTSSAKLSGVATGLGEHKRDILKLREEAGRSPQLLRSRIGSKIQIIIMRGIRIAGKHPLVVICETPPAVAVHGNHVQISKIWPHCHV
jgi:hypothetical protein